jgi:hypothetical protein
LVQAATWSSTDRSPYNNLVLDIRLLLSQRLDFYCAYSKTCLPY